MSFPKSSELIAKLPPGERNVDAVPREVAISSGDTLWDSVMPESVNGLLDAVVIGDDVNG